MGYSQAMRDAMLNALRGTAFSLWPSTVYVTWLTTNPTDETGTGLVEVQAGSGSGLWTGYTRQPVSSNSAGWAAPSGTVPRVISNAAIINFGNASILSGTITMTGVAIYSASSGGTLLYWTPIIDPTTQLVTTKVVNNTDNVTIAANALQLGE